MRGKSFSVIGKRLPKIDAISKVTGAAKYIDDMSLPNMLYGKILRSPHPHAEIIGIETSKAEKVPGVKAVITGKDIANITKPYGRFVKDELALQPHKTRYVGDALAAVAATSQDIAEEAMGLIEVEYKELPAVFDPEEAMKPGASLIHAHVDRNICARLKVFAGDVERALKNADRTFQERITTSKVTATPMEPHTSLASYDAINGKLTLWAPTQTPFQSQKALAEILNLPMHKVRIIIPEAGLGGGFGHKVTLSPDMVVASFLSFKTGKPVKIALSREEETAATYTRHPVTIKSEMGVKNDGTIVAHKCEVIADTGAYADDGPCVAGAVGGFLHHAYNIPNVLSDVFTVYTNKTVAGAYRGYGNPQATFAREIMIDIVAENLGMDPVEFRLKNIVKASEETSTGLKISNCGLEKCIKEAAKAVGWEERRRKKKPYRGIGIAAFIHGTGYRYMTDADNCGAYLKMNEDGTANLFVGCVEMGNGIRTTLAQVAAEKLGIRLEDISVAAIDTESTPFCMPTDSSRSALIGGNAVRVAAEDARKQLLNVASKMLDADPADLVVRDRKVYVKIAPEKSVSIADVVKASQYSRIGGSKARGQIIIGRGYFDADTRMFSLGTSRRSSSTNYAFGAHAVEVEVDPETGQVRILKYVAAHDVGRALNPTIVEGQIEGGVTQGIGYALFEEMIYGKQGRLLNAGFLDYKIPTALDAPRVKTIIVEEIDPRTPIGVKGVGEPPIVPVAAAISNAIYDAVGVRFKELPITPEKILKALKPK